MVRYKEIQNWTKDVEYLTIVLDLLENKLVQKLNNYTQHYSVTRLEHSISVSYLSYLMAKEKGLNYIACARAGLLHDLFFYETSDDVYKDSKGKGHAYMHPRIALQNAKEITSISKLEEDIIVKHMFGVTTELPKYPESWIVTYVDKKCAIYEGKKGYKEIMNHYKLKLLKV